MLTPPLFFATVTRQGLSALDYTLLAVYFALNLGIGWWCARKQSGSSSGYFLGGRKVLWWAAAVSFFATSTSSISFMALPAKTYQSDWMAFGSAPAQGLAGLMVGFVFVGLLRRLNLTTIYGYLDQRFDMKVRLLGSGLAVLLKLFGRMSVVMLLPALALSTVTGLNVYLSILLMGVVTTIYAMEGGFDAVIWTDVMQVVVTYGGVVIALFFLASGVDGGLAGIIATGTDLGKFKMISWEPTLTQPTVWVFIGMFFGHIFTQLADQPLMQRMLASTDATEARRTVVLGNVLGMMSSLVFFFIGTALFVFYRAHPERLEAALPNDAIFPYFIANELPSGIVGLIVAGLFAAAMGAMSSTLNSIAAMVVTDFQLTFRPKSPEKSQVRLARATTLLSGVIATGMAAFLAWRNVSSLWDEFLRLIALIGGGFPGVFALGFLTRRANARGVIIGTFASIAITWWVQNYTQTSVFLHSFVAIASCMIIGYVASILAPDGSRPKNFAGLTLWDLRTRAKPTSK
ncbi:sodium:solute symporter [Oleiharenicola lentus]|uniref:sodium:solute symporter n=1 Tax=Oleiharenicola lentus TaxID=2508720 RepID=UPI003F67D823